MSNENIFKTLSALEVELEKFKSAGELITSSAKSNEALRGSIQKYLNLLKETNTLIKSIANETQEEQQRLSTQYVEAFRKNIEQAKTELSKFKNESVATREEWFDGLNQKLEDASQNILKHISELEETSKSVSDEVGTYLGAVKETAQELDGTSKKTVENFQNEVVRQLESLDSKIRDFQNKLDTTLLGETDSFEKKTGAIIETFSTRNAEALEHFELCLNKTKNSAEAFQKEWETRLSSVELARSLKKFEDTLSKLTELAESFSNLSEKNNNSLEEIKSSQTTTISKIDDLQSVAEKSVGDSKNRDLAITNCFTEIQRAQKEISSLEQKIKEALNEFSKDIKQNLEVSISGLKDNQKSLENALAEIRQESKEVADKITDIESEVKSLGEVIDIRFKRLEENLASQPKELPEQLEKIGSIKEQILRQNSQLDDLKTNLKVVETNSSSVKSKFDVAERKVEGLSRELSDMETNSKKYQTKIIFILAILIFLNLIQFFRW